MRFLESKPKQRSRPISPIFLLGDVNAAVLQSVFGQLDTRAIGCHEVHDIVLSVNKASARLPANTQPIGTGLTLTRRSNAKRRPDREIAGPVAVIDANGFFDVMSKIWVLQGCGIDPGALRYVVEPGCTPDAERALSSLGIGAVQIEVRIAPGERIFAERLFVPTGLRCRNRVDTSLRQAAAYWRDRLSPALKPSQAETRIFVTHSEQPGQPSNIADLRSIAVQRGYTPLDLADLSMAEQLSLYAGARCIVEAFDSATSRSIFSGPSTVVCCLRGSAERHDHAFAQSGVAQALGQHAGYVIGAMVQSESGTAFVIDTADFESALDIMALHVTPMHNTAPALAGSWHRQPE